MCLAPGCTLGPYAIRTEPDVIFNTGNGDSLEVLRGMVAAR